MRRLLSIFIVRGRLLRSAVAAAGLLACAAVGLGVSVSVAAPAGQIVVAEGGYRCDGPIDVDLLRVTNPGGSAGLTITTGCSGRIGRLEITGVRNDDGVKVQNSGPSGPLTVGGGFVQCAGPPTDGTHQDGVQAMGGHDLLFQDVVFDCWGGGGGNWFVARGGGGYATPTNVICDGCVFGPNFGPRAPNVQTQTSVGSGVRNGLVCQPRSGRYRAGGGVYENMVEAPQGDARCASLEAMVAWAEGGAEPAATGPATTTEPTTTEPPTTTGPEPEPAVCDAACVADWQARVDALEDHVAALEAEREALIAQVDADQQDAAALEQRIADLEQQLIETEAVRAEVVRLNGIIDAARAELNQQ